MTTTPEELRRQLRASIEAIPDYEERLKEAVRTMDDAKVHVREVKAGIAKGLKSEGRTWEQVGEFFGVSGARAEQISRASR
ncbi:hypothetical protein [Streptomyces sp. MJP52]|uniref:hypothetical protein n=1 Tax=Streptomyces sp. MJP52 TaxID=2940555 RepID=UPI00247657A9|nr:hypothetical protein [Streptomyces sp. MJP52]MDH6224332.1 DNA-directed RNA polymerase sigma subunit (sigma70/sigma32) [Streptomyces sp. MJP52]